MRAHRIVILAAIAAIGPGSAALAQQIIVPEDLAAPAAQVSPAVSKSIEAIQAANEPSAVINALIDAERVAPNDLGVADAYVRKMAELNQPSLAETQARELVKRDPNNHFARAVVAAASAQRGTMGEALEEISAAAVALPQDPFVLRTAGFLVAWYDHRADQSTFSEAIKQSVATMRTQISGRQAFVAAYNEASDAYRKSNATAGANAESPPDAPDSGAVTTAPQETRGETVYSSSGPTIYYPTYVEVPVYRPYYSYSRPSYYYDNCGPYTGGAVIIPNRYPHHRPLPPIASGRDPRFDASPPIVIRPRPGPSTPPVVTPKPTPTPRPNRAPATIDRTTPQPARPPTVGPTYAKGNPNKPVPAQPPPVGPTYTTARRR